MRHLAHCVLFLILLSSSLLKAQTTSDTPVDLGVWLGYEGNHELGKDSPWRLVGEGTAKRNQELIDAQANFLLGGLGYEWKRDRQISAGYEIQQHIPFDSSSQPYKWVEHRLFQEVRYMLQTVRNSAETAEGLKRINNVFRVTFLSDARL
jgi:hypothetical protein